MAAINTKAVIPFITLVIFIFTGCTDDETNQAQLKSQIDGLRDQIQKIEKGYKPGFGELMGVIQVHHAKLWFAGTNENWKLVEFEIHEIEETFEKISELHGNRYNDSKLVPALALPFLKSTREAAQNKDLPAFKERYNQLTAGCNSCHSDNGFDFIVIKTPTEPVFTNQDFKISN
jgi:hypothetical protein